MKDDLLHWWDLADLDDQHGSWDLTNNGTVVFDSDGGPDGGPCAVFNGSNYLDRSDVAWDGAGTAMSLQCWVKVESVSNFGNWLISHRFESGDDRLHQLFVRGPSLGDEDKPSASFFSTGGNTSVRGPGELDIGVWYHLITTSNGSNEHKLYVNGSEVDYDDGSIGALSTSSIPFAIGAGSFNKGEDSLRHDGDLCNVGIWGRELTSAEVAELWNSGSGLRYADLDAAPPGPEISGLVVSSVGSDTIRIEGVSEGSLLHILVQPAPGADPDGSTEPTHFAEVTPGVPFVRDLSGFTPGSHRVHVRPVKLL